VGNIVAFDALGQVWQIQGHGQVLHGLDSAVGGRLGPHQLILGIALYHFHQVGFGLPLGNFNGDFAAPALGQVLRQDIPLGQLMLGQNNRGDLDGIHGLVVVFQHPLQDFARGRGLCIGGKAQPPHQATGPHLKNLHGGMFVVRRQGNGILGHSVVGQGYFLIGAEPLQALNLIPQSGGLLKLDGFGSLFHLVRISTSSVVRPWNTITTRCRVLR